MSDLYLLNTRLRAMRSRLLTRGDYEEILGRPDLPGIAALLRESPYGRHVGSGDGTETGAGRIEEAVRRDLSETMRRVQAVAGGDCREAVRLVLGEREREVVKTVLRGKVAGLPAAEILSAAVPTGLHDEAALEEMCRQPDPRALASLLATWGEAWGRALLRALREYREPRDLFLLEAAVDRVWFAEAAERLPAIPPRGDGDGGGPLSLFLSLSADGTNFLTALRAVEEGIAIPDPDRYFLPGGRILPRRAFDRILAARTVRGALEAAGKFRARRLVAGLPDPSAGAPFLPLVERELERMRMRAARWAARTDPFGWGPLLRYLLEKFREARNLRMIVRARIADLPDPELHRFLILDY